MKKLLLEVAGKKCIVYAGEQPRVLLVQPVGEHEQGTLDAQIEAIREAVDMPFVFAGVPISDWEKELTPWSDPNLNTTPSPCSRVRLVHKQNPKRLNVSIKALRISICFPRLGA